MLLLVALAGGYILLIPPVIGLANQSDFRRLMGPVGIDYPPDLTPEHQSWCYTDVHFVLTRPGPAENYSSSQSLLIRLALGVNKFLSKSNTFDIRMLAAIELTILLFLFYRLSRLLEMLAGRGRIVGLIVAALILCDVGYLAYFNTFYCEPGVFLFGVAFVLFLFESLRGASAWNIGLLSLSSLLLVTSKPQYAPMAIVIAFCMVALVFLLPDWRRLRWLSVPGAAIVLVAGLYTLAAPTGGYSNASLYNAVFNGLLYESDNPRADLGELGIDPDAAAFKATTTFSANKAGPELFPGTATSARLFFFYFGHPKLLLRRTSRVITETRLSNRSPSLGNFQRGYGYRCGEHTEAFMFWDWVRSRLARIGVVGGFFLITIPTALFLGIWRKSSYALGYVIVAGVAIASFYVAAIGDMTDPRHQLLFHLLLDGCICFVAIYATEPVLRTAGAAASWAGGLVVRAPEWEKAIVRPRVLVPAGIVAVVLAVGWWAPFGSQEVRLRVMFTRQAPQVTEPVLQMGAAPGAADALAVIFLPNDHIVLFFDHWGTPRCESTPHRVRLDEYHDVRLRVNGKNRSTSIFLDGEKVMSCTALYNPDLHARVLGKNTFGFTTMRREFSGRVDLVGE